MAGSYDPLCMPSADDGPLDHAQENGSMAAIASLINPSVDLVPKNTPVDWSKYNESLRLKEEAVKRMGPIRRATWDPRSGRPKWAPVDPNGVDYYDYNGESEPEMSSKFISSFKK